MKKKKSIAGKSEERLKELQRALVQLDEKLTSNEIYFEKAKRKKSEIREAETRKIKRLGKELMHYKKELAGNADYIKRHVHLPKQKLADPSELRCLTEERKTVLKEMIEVKKQIENLEKERIRLENEQFKIESDQHTERLKEYEDAVREELLKLAAGPKTAVRRRPKPVGIIRKKIRIRKRRKPSVPNKLLQSYLNKLNRELEEIKAKSKK